MDHRTLCTSGPQYNKKNRDRDGFSLLSQRQANLPFSFTTVFSRAWNTVCYMCIDVLFAQSCPILRDPMDCSPQASLSMGFSRQEYWSGLPFPSPEVCYIDDK